MRRFLITIAVVFGAIYLWNASWLAGTPDNAKVRLIAHRGVHQTYDRTDLDNDTCTAKRIFTPTHEIFENTIVSMHAAFAAGADVVELDVHPTTDNQFAVFHDWTIDCRTEGEGTTRSHDMAYLKTLDIGYGYTTDNGVSFPLRGKGIGLMPSFDEIMKAFPDKQFLVNFKSRESREGDMLAQMLNANPTWRNAIWGVYGGNEPTFRATELIGNLKGYSSRTTKDCLIKYLALGWTGYLPHPCRNTYIMVPANYAWLLSGWPNRFHARMQAAGSEIVLLGPFALKDPGAPGIDEMEQLKLVPKGFDGYIWTNKIEIIGPALDAQN